MRTKDELKGLRTLYEAVRMNFSKTPSGKVYEKCIKDIYSMMIICLKLKDGREKNRFTILHRSYPYTFYEQDALETMKSLLMDIETSNTVTTISYSIKPPLGKLLLKKFYDAKLIHSPADRTRNRSSSNVSLQPTPKGLAIVQHYFKKMGGCREHFPEVLMSNLNTMDLFTFERDPINDRILYSEYLVQLIFVKMMGDKPNIWSPDRNPDPLPKMDVRLDFTDPREIQFGLSRITSLIQDSQRQKERRSNLWDLGLKLCHSEENANLKEQDMISPLHHRFFTNPESDSHIQYYVSNSGVRFSRDKVFHNDNKIKLKICLTGKSICQWLTDCTDVISLAHAVEIGNLFLTYKFLTPMLNAPSTSTVDKFSDRRDAFYSISFSALKFLNWSEKYSDYISEIIQLSNERMFESFTSGSLRLHPSAVSKQFTLRDSLKDPGMRYLFKKHLEKEFCSENLEAYIQLRQFEKKLNILNKLIKIKESREYSQQVFIAAKQIAEECLNLAYHTYFTFLSKDSPSMLNIDYNLQSTIETLMLTKVIKLTEKERHDSLTEDSCTEISHSELLLEEESSKSGLSVSFKASPHISFKSSAKLENVASNIVTAGETVETQIITCCDADLYPEAEEDKCLTDKFLLLIEVTNAFEEVRRHVFRLMEVDSYPKFLNSEIYRNAISFVSIVNKV